MKKAAFLLVLLSLGCSRQTQPAAGAHAEQQKAQAGAVTQPSTEHQPPGSPGTSGPATLTPESSLPSGAVSSAPATSAPSPASASPEPSSASAQITKHDTDTPLVVAGQTYHFVVHTLRLEHPGPRRPDDDETVESWELRDPTGKVAFQESLGTPAVQGNGFESTESVGATSFTTQQGSGVLVDGEGLPSAPDSGGWTLMLGLHDGRLTPFGPPIYANEYLGLGTDPQRLAQEAQSGGKLMPMHDVLNFRLWTGNFNIVYPVLINWIAGRLEPSWRCIRGSGTEQVERCPYEVKASPFPVKEQTFVRLYELAEDTGKPQHIVVQPGTKIEFLEAEGHVTWNGNAKALTLEPQSDDIWLKIRINGKEGWIHSQEDFDAVGLPEAG
ncbi:MAG TPA: hypothetical protein VKE93_18530 [Candidatus Angelobacter sp.]|nr:hypothetical protein [Candidatus Angelobacter sp.]